MKNLFLAATLDGSLAQIVEKLNVLMDSFWIYIVLALACNKSECRIFWFQGLA